MHIPIISYFDMNSDQGQWLILITIPITEWSQYPKYINSPFDKLCLSRVTIVTNYHRDLVISKSGSHHSWCTKRILNQPHIKSYKPPGALSWSPRLTSSMNKFIKLSWLSQIGRNCPIPDYRGGPGLWECLRQLGGQPDPDHSVHHRLPHPQPGVPRHHHLRPGDILTVTRIMFILCSGNGQWHPWQGSKREIP